jgi:hypothetical protein
MSGRTYANDSFSGKQLVQGLVAGNAINGTRSSAAVLETLVVSAPTQYNVKSFRVFHGVAGTCAITTALTLCTSLAGTGANVAIGTAVAGTATEIVAPNASKVGSASGTLLKGDKLVVVIPAGTETAANIRVVPVVEMVEDFTNA